MYTVEPEALGVTMVEGTLHDTLWNPRERRFRWLVKPPLEAVVTRAVAVDRDKASTPQSDREKINCVLKPGSISRPRRTTTLLAHEGRELIDTTVEIQIIVHRDNLSFSPQAVPSRFEEFLAQPLES
ncbi:hypothetical protein GCM10022247_05170 [Allokutzneria multivorans]|uniref:Uncharacterized protein n=1 Tax=Allokutzneria multivorans TaxID=1142134 RepID=A0ABP7QXR7_9PSEU